MRDTIGSIIQDGHPRGIDLSLLFFHILDNERGEYGI